MRICFWFDVWCDNWALCEVYLAILRSVTHRSVFGGLMCISKLLFSFGKILTIENLRKLVFVVTKWCYMCKKHEKSVDHLLLHGQVAKALLDRFFWRVRLAWMLLMKVVDLLECSNGFYSCHQVVIMRKMVHLCLMWGILFKMNEQRSNNKECTLEGIYNFFVYSWFLLFLAIALYGASA